MISLPLHSSRMHSLHNLSSLGTVFHLPVSISKGADPSLNIISILLWLFSCTFQHLPSRPFAYSTQSSKHRAWVYFHGLLPNPSPYTCMQHSSASPLFASLNPQPEWHSCSPANQRPRPPNKFLTSPSTGLFSVP